MVGVRDPGDPRREIWQVEGTGGWRDPGKLENKNLVDQTLGNQGITDDQKKGGLGDSAIERFQEIKEENLVGRGRRDQQSPGSKGPLERQGIEKGAGDPRIQWL